MVSGAKQLMGGLVAAALVTLMALPSTAGAASLRAHGSVQQVYVIGARAGERLTLFDGHGRAVAAQRAGPLGGVVFRRVAPGRGYRVGSRCDRATDTHVDRSTGPIGAAVHAHLRAAHPGLGLRLPDHARRDQARDRRPPARRPRPVPDAGRVRGLRLRRPGGGGERHQPDRQPARVRGGRREHARDGLLRGRVRLLRDAAEPRRLRRDRDRGPPALGPESQGRDAGNLLRRDQPAVRRGHRSPQPGRDRAALGDRQHRDDAVPGWDPQHGLRADVRARPATTTPRRPRRGAARRGR